MRKCRSCEFQRRSIFKHIWWTLLAICIIMLAGLASCSQDSEKSAHNLILITLDTTRPDRLGCYGYAKAKTPNLDQLAQESILFENAVCPSPSTVPSHSSIMTGLYPPHHGVRVTGRHSLPSHMMTLADVLKKEGYRTGAVISGYPLTKRFGLNKGFDFYEDSFWGNSEEAKIVIERIAERSIDIALKWLNENKDDRFFFWLHLYDPHSDYAPPPPFDTEYRDDPYDGEIAYMDWSLGHFFKKLKEWNLYDTSVIIIVGDHGEGLGEHGESEHQFLIYNTTMKVPFFMRVGKEYVPRRIEALVGVIDIFPTVLDLLNVSCSTSIDGSSLRPMLRGSSDRKERRSYYLETLSGEISLGWSPLYALMNEEWKFIEAPEPELYHMANDPDESHNLFFQERETAEEFGSQLEKTIQDLSKAGVSADAQLDEEALKNLASLGYISSGTFERKGTKGAKDPKKYIHIERDINELYKLFLTKKYGDALPHIKTILQVDPENRLALLYAGTIYYEKREYIKALHYLEALNQHFQDEIGNEMLIRIYSAQNKKEQALEICDASIEHFPEKAQFHSLKGLMLVALKRYQDAIESFNDSLSLDSANPETHYYLARCYALTGRENEAIEAVIKSLENGLSRPDVYLQDPAFRNMRRFEEVEAILGSLKR